MLIMLSARFLGNAMKLGEKISLYKGECLLVTMATGIAAFGVLVQPDLGTAAIIAALVMGMFIVAGLPARWITTIVGVGAVGAVLLSISSEYRLQRLHVWFDPWLDPQGKGYQMVQSLLAIGSGGLTGTNWGHGAAKFAYLPEAHTDFAFAIFCQENGFFGALILLLVFCLLGVAFIRLQSVREIRRAFAGSRSYLFNHRPGLCQYGDGLRYFPGYRCTAYFYQLRRQLDDNFNGGNRLAAVGL